LNDSFHLDPTWRRPPENVSLPLGTVHVWLLFDHQTDATESAREILTPDELARVARYAEARARSFSGIRSTLRKLLSRYASVPPQDIAFSYGPHGKPAFPQGGIHFSVSHAHDRALLAFCRSAPVGIDLERVRGHRRFDALSARFFSEPNAAVIARATASARPRIFTAAWAQREAFVKAVGGGLYATPDLLPFRPGDEPPRLDTTPDGEHWMIAPIHAGNEFEARLVAAASTSSGHPAILPVVCYAEEPFEDAV
jgi:4'-phosphopantetheinyl transferase